VFQQTTKISSRLIAGLIGAVVIFISLLVMMGWCFDIAILKTLLPGYITMKFNTALALLCFGIVQVILASTQEKSWRQTSFVLLIFGTSISVLTLAQYIFELDLGIDELLYADTEGIGKTYPPGRLAPVTAINFILLGLSVYLAFFKKSRLYKLSQIILVATAVISFQALISYILSMQLSFQVATHPRMAIHTAASFVLLGTGFLFLQLTRGYLLVLVSSTAAGASARKLIGMAIFTPPFFSLIEFLGTKYQIFGPDFGVMLRVIGTVMLFVVVIWQSADQLHFSARERRRQQNKLLKSERDLSTHIKQEQDAVAAKQEALRTTKIKSDFLASMSHEIRTPLNGIMGMLALLSNTELNSLQKNLVQTMDMSSQVLLNLINQILDLSKIEAGKVDLLENNFELKALVESVIAIVELPARQKHLIMSSQVHSDAVGFYLGDSFRIQQVLLNLLHNAVKFSDRGIITLKISKQNSTAEQTLLLFEVVDNGVGVDDAGMDKLFQAFSQLETSGVRSGDGGTGLGLAISKKLVELMNGRIGVESKKGLGSRFFFELPLKNSKVLSPPDSIVEKSVRGKEKISGHVLVAEDNKVNQRVTSSMLDILGCTMKVVETGKDAIEALRSEPFDIILMDGQMPELDGYEATRRIRKGEAGTENTKIPILAVTANVVQGSAQNCYDAGMNDFISKPIDFDDFTYKVKKWISRGRSVIDTKTIELLQQLALGGNKNLIKDLVGLFKQETTPILKTMRTQVEQGDFASVAKSAHHLKSSCANLGVYKMQELTEKIEKLKMNGTRELLIPLVDELEKEFQIATSELQKYMS